MIQRPTDEVTLDLDGSVLTITLNRPQKLNAVTAQMSDALVIAVNWANDCDDVRAIVLTGAGDRSFCVGSDIAELDRYDSPWQFRNRTDYCDVLRRLRKPVIAAVNGYAFGGGLETALLCDIRIAASTASFAAAEVKLGWIGGGGASALLTRSIGPGNAAVMLMTGDPIDAEQACAWGLVSELQPQEALLQRGQDLARTIAQRPPIAVQTAKADLAAAAEMGLDSAIAYERDLQTICFATRDAAEGRAAFAQRRPGVFEGR